MATLILLSAIPGSGKSTWAKQYQKEHPNTYIVASDEIRESFFGSAQNFSHEKEVWQIFLDKINEHAEADASCTVIADATNLRNQYRLYYCKQTPKFDKHVLILFKIPFEICLIQNRMRKKGRIVPEKAMQKLIAEYEEPSEEVLDAYDECWTIGKSFVSEEAKKKI